MGRLKFKLMLLLSRRVESDIKFWFADAGKRKPPNQSETTHALSIRSSRRTYVIHLNWVMGARKYGGLEDPSLKLARHQ